MQTTGRVAPLRVTTSASPGPLARCRPANHLCHVAPDQLGLAPPELLDRGPVHRLHAASRVRGNEQVAHRPDEVVHVGLRHRGRLEALRHVVERRGERPELVRGRLRQTDRRVAGSETVGRVGESRDRTRDRARGEEPEEHGQPEREHGEQHVVAIGLGESGLDHGDRLAQLPLGGFLVALDERQQHVDVVGLDPLVEVALRCVRGRPRDLFELPSNERCAAISSSILSSHVDIVVPLPCAGLGVSHLLGHRQRPLGGAPARVELFLEGGQADLDGLRRAGGCALPRLRPRCADRSLHEAETSSRAASSVSLSAISMSTAPTSSWMELRRRCSTWARPRCSRPRAPADHAHQRGDPQQAEEYLESDPHVLDITA